MTIHLIHDPKSFELSESLLDDNAAVANRLRAGFVLSTEFATLRLLVGQNGPLGVLNALKATIAHQRFVLSPALV